MHTYVKFTLTQIRKGLFRLRRSYLSSYPWFALQTTGVRIIKLLFTEPSRLAVRQYFCRNCVTLNLTMGFRNSGNFSLHCTGRRLCLYKLTEDTTVIWESASALPQYNLTELANNILRVHRHTHTRIILISF